MTEIEKMKLLEETWEIDDGELTPDTILDDIDEYDSMAKLVLIVMMDDEFGITLDGNTIKEFKTVSDILALMK